MLRYLHTTCLVSQITIFYEIHYRLVNTHMPQTISPAKFIGIRDHQLKYAIPVATTDRRKFYFHPCSINIWNYLPSTAVFAASPAAFQTAALPAVAGIHYFQDTTITVFTAPLVCYSMFCLVDVIYFSAQMPVVSIFVRRC